MWIQTHQFSHTTVNLKILSPKLRPLCPDNNELTITSKQYIVNYIVPFSLKGFGLAGGCVSHQSNARLKIFKSSQVKNEVKSKCFIATKSIICLIQSWPQLHCNGLIVVTTGIVWMQALRRNGHCSIATAVSSCTKGYHAENLQCNHWRQCRHNYDPLCSSEI